MTAATTPPKTKPINTNSTGQSPPAFKFLTVREALNRPKSKFLVQDYIAENSINFIVGPPGSAKTFFALDLAIEMIKPNLGLMAETWSILKPLKVMYMTNEGLDEIASNDGRLASLLAHKSLYDGTIDQLTHNCTDNLLIIEDMLNLFQDIGRSQYAKFLTQFLAFQPDVIFIDTYANAVVGSEENSNKEVNKIGENMRQLKNDMSCALILLHHTAKGIQVSKGQPYVGRGAGSLGGFSDCIIGLLPDTDDEDCSIIHHCKAKHGRLQPSKLMNRVKNPNYYYPFLEYDTYSTKVQQQAQQKQDEIIEALTQFGAMSITKLVDATGIQRTSIVRRCNDLVKNGLLKKELEDNTRKPSKNNAFIFDIIPQWP